MWVSGRAGLIWLYLTVWPWWRYVLYWVQIWLFFFFVFFSFFKQKVTSDFSLKVISWFSIDTRAAPCAQEGHVVWLTASGVNNPVLRLIRRVQTHFLCIYQTSQRLITAGSIHKDFFLKMPPHQVWDVVEVLLVCRRLLLSCSHKVIWAKKHFLQHFQPSAHRARVELNVLWCSQRKWHLMISVWPHQRNHVDVCFIPKEFVASGRQ